ncbi:MAG: hypothetical protein GX605_07845 [Chloroflexi bacterium]|nr:hypothetical protein [Chloroflexota bacterium]
MRWAWIPAGVLLVMGALISFSATSLLNLVGPLALIVGGVVLVWQALRRR